MTSKEIFSIISKQWANVNDIKILASCGRDKASKIRNDIITDITNKGKYLPISKSKIVPMSSVIDYLNLDLKYIYLMTENEKRLETLKSN